MKLTRTYLADLILEKLIISKIKLNSEFNQNGRINSCVIDDLLPADIAQKIYEAFPSPEEMTAYKPEEKINGLRHKWTYIIHY